ncbi:hypothetical protein LBMAG53_11920 [Planctomycetota bacterium]|nr:hypothetical protein LBMAG53_11920 [Planctomycetota bacterium]
MADQPDDLYVDVRPMRLKARLAFWITLSVAVHVALAVALWLSPDLQKLLFGGLQASDSPPTAGQMEASRRALDALTRKRIATCSKKILAISAKVEAMRAGEWKQVATKAEANPHFKAMLDQGLPPLELSAVAGDADRQDVATLYQKTQDLERQVISLYEQYKSVGLSLLTVRQARAEDLPQPQPLSDSLKLCAVERPSRPALDLAVINGPVAPGESWLAFRGQMTLASETSEIMANNCQRIIDVVNRVIADLEVGPSMPIPGGGADNWKEENAYRGPSLRLSEMLPSNLASTIKDAKVVLGKTPGGDESSRPADWMALDTWWVIGPFPYLTGQRDETSLTHAYPPEHTIDLSEPYAGLNNKPLRWEYRPMDKVRMEPRDVGRRMIWYFYTEFWSDEARTVFANVASDDYGVMWLNGKRDPVYTSGVEARPWVLFDANQFVQLDLKKGTNRLLLKLDNNGGTTGMTVVLGLHKLAGG